MPQIRGGEVQSGRKRHFIVTHRWLGGSGLDHRFLCWANTDRPLLAVDEGIGGEAETGAFLPWREAVRVLTGTVFSLVLIPGRSRSLERHLKRVDLEECLSSRSTAVRTHPPRCLAEFLATSAGAGGNPEGVSLVGLLITDGSRSAAMAVPQSSHNMTGPRCFILL